MGHCCAPVSPASGLAVARANVMFRIHLIHHSRAVQLSVSKKKGKEKTMINSETMKYNKAFQKQHRVGQRVGLTTVF